MFEFIYCFKFLKKRALGFLKRASYIFSYDFLISFKNICYRFFFLLMFLTKAFKFRRLLVVIHTDTKKCGGTLIFSTHFIMMDKRHWQNSFIDVTIPNKWHIFCACLVRGHFLPFYGSFKTTNSLKSANSASNFVYWYLLRDHDYNSSRCEPRHSTPRRSGSEISQVRRRTFCALQGFK